nr:MAG TPA: PI31 proteasome regulator N-terminal [Caudoviricetes sp.]
MYFITNPLYLPPIWDSSESYVFRLVSERSSLILRALRCGLLY